MRKLLSTFAIIMALAGVGLGVFLPAAALAASDELIPGCQGQGASSPTCSSHNSTTNNPLTGATGILTRATQIIAVVSGVASVIMIIVGGFRYVLSNGDASGAASGRKTIIYATVGLMITISAGTIISFVLSKI